MDTDKQTTSNVEQTVTFTEAARETEAAVITLPTTLESKELLLTSVETRDHSIADFLMRPVQIATFTLTAAAVQNQELIALDFPEAYTTKLAYLQKLLGFYSFSGTLSISIFANCQPFDCACLRAIVIPNAQNMPNKTSTLTGNITSMTSLPNVEMLLPQTSLATLEFPFISNFTGVNLMSGEGAYGRFAVHVLTPLRTTQSTEVQFTIFVKMIDPVVEFPTGGPIAASLLSTKQSFMQWLEHSKDVDMSVLKNMFPSTVPKPWRLPSMFSRRKIEHPLEDTEVQSSPKFNSQPWKPPPPPGHVHSDNLFVPDVDFVELQSGNIVAEEAAFKSAGSITKGLLCASGVASVASLFPVLTPFAAPIAVAAAGLAGVAALFGWSKPSNLGTTSFFKAQGARNMANANGEDNSHMLAMCAGNHLDQKPSVFGNELDEMSLATIASTPAVISTFQWSTTPVAGEILKSFPVTPVLSNYITTDELAMPLMAFAQNPFSYWAGSINFSFTVVSTQYHKGRLRFTFVPGHYYDDLSDVDVNKCYSEVLDVQQGNHMVFNVPYIATAPWLFADFADNVAVEQDERFRQGNISSATGTIFVTVLNPLTITSAVSANIDIIAEVCAGPDMRRAVPRAYPYVPSGTQLAHNAPPGAMFHDNDTELQSGADMPLHITRNQWQRGYTPAPIGGACESNPTDFTRERNTIGEVYCSIAAIMKRFTPIYHATAQGINDIIILPYAKVSPTVIPQNIPFDDFSYWSYIYAYARGGMRIKIAQSAELTLPGDFKVYDMLNVRFLTDHTGVEYNALLDLYSATDSPVITDLTVPIGLGSDIQQAIPLNIEGLAEIAVPFYNRFHTIPLEINQLPNKLQVDAGNFPPTIIRVTNEGHQAFGDHPVHVTVHRAVADDFRMGYLVGSPIMIKTLY